MQAENSVTARKEVAKRSWTVKVLETLKIEKKKPARQWKCNVNMDGLYVYNCIVSETLANISPYWRFSIKTVQFQLKLLKLTSESEKTSPDKKKLNYKHSMYILRFVRVSIKLFKSQ